MSVKSKFVSCISMLLVVASFGVACGNTESAELSYPNNIATSDLANEDFIAYVLDKKIYLSSNSGVVQLTGDALSTLGLSSWSPDNKRFLVTGTSGDELSTSGIYTISADGNVVSRLTDDSIWSVLPSWSPDGQKIAFLSSNYRHNGEPGVDIYVMNKDGAELTRLTQGNFELITYVAWSPNSDDIVFVDSFQSVYLTQANGSGYQEIFDEAIEIEDVVWNPNGTSIAISHATGDTISILGVTQPYHFEDVLTEHQYKLSPTWSPSGDQIAFRSENTSISIATIDNDTLSTLDVHTIDSTLLQEQEVDRIDGLSWSSSSDLIAFTTTQRIKLDPTCPEYAGSRTSVDADGIKFTTPCYRIEYGIFTLSTDGSKLEKIVDLPKSSHHVDIIWIK